MPNDEGYGMILTNVGINKIATAINSGPKVDINTVAVGDSNGESYTPTGEETQLKNQCWSTEDISYEVSVDDPHQLIIKAQIPADVGHFFIREIGIFDSEGTLIAIGKTIVQEKVPNSQNAINVVNISAYLQLTAAQADAVNIVVQETEVDEKLRELEEQIVIIKNMDGILKQDETGWYIEEV